MAAGMLTLGSEPSRSAFAGPAKAGKMVRARRSLSVLRDRVPAAMETKLEVAVAPKPRRIAAK